MDQADIKLLPPRDGEQKKTPILGSLMEKGMQVGPPPQHSPWLRGDGCCPTDVQTCTPKRGLNTRQPFYRGPKRAIYPRRGFLSLTLCVLSSSGVLGCNEDAKLSFGGAEGTRLLWEEDVWVLGVHALICSG